MKIINRHRYCDIMFAILFLIYIYTLHVISHVYFRYTEDVKATFIFLKIKLCNNSISVF